MAKLTSKRNLITLVNLDKPSEKVEACFNPREITIDKKIPWNKHKKSKGDLPDLEFTNAEPETLSVELLFDTYEKKTSVYDDYVVGLRAMTLIDTGGKGVKKRPPKVMLQWGEKEKKFLKFDGVITSLSTKYTMFLPNGIPVRATCTLSIQQAGKVKAKVPKKKKTGTGTGTG